MMSPISKVISYGGGLDSFAMLLEALHRNEKPDAVVFVDVSDGALDREHTEPGEWPGTYRHLREVVAPLCKSYGVEFVWLSSDKYPVRDATSLFGWLRARKQIPVAGPNRVCTTVAKVERFERWLNDRFPRQEVEVWIGFESGEEKRAAKDPNAGTKPAKKGKANADAARRKNRFPLIEWGMCRCRCEQLVRSIGAPVPRKSACTFCPYGSLGDWQTFARELPEVFVKVAQLEADKPPTKRGMKLSIRNFHVFKKGVPKKTKLTILRDSAGVPYTAPSITEYVKGKFRPKKEACGVCGAAARATKATGCDYLA